MNRHSSAYNIHQAERMRHANREPRHTWRTIASAACFVVCMACWVGIAFLWLAMADAPLEVVK